MFTMIDGKLPVLGRIWQRRDSRNLSRSYTWAIWTVTLPSAIRGDLRIPLSTQYSFGRTSAA